MTLQPVGKTWQKTKSELTRTSILDAAVDCFYELGYAKTTTENIAQAAGVSRGAMLHHFPTRFVLIKATIEHLNRKRLEWFEEEESVVQKGAEHTRIEEGIDTYWKQLNSPTFIVFHELKVAARTDKELAKVLLPAMEEFEKAFYQSVRKIFSDLVLSEAFERSNFLTQYLLEGMAMAQMSSASKIPHKMMIAWLKRELRRSYQDVLSTVKRPAD